MYGFKTGSMPHTGTQFLANAINEALLGRWLGACASNILRKTQLNAFGACAVVSGVLNSKHEEMEHALEMIAPPIHTE
jgi:hypothetical protein